MALFPGALPAAGAATSTDTLAAAGHTSLHNTAYDELRAIGTKMGTGASTPTSSQVLRGTGVGTSGWGQVVLTTDISGILPVANGGIGQATLTALPLNAPVITDFTSATHNHQNNAGGSQLTTNALSNASITADKLSLGGQPATVATSETTTSTSYGDLTTTTDTVTVTIGANGIALVVMQSFISNNTINAINFVSVDITGANTIAAADTKAIEFQAYAANAEGQFGDAFMLTGLTPGSTTFKMKYKVQTGGSGAGTGTFKNRMLAVIPL